ncbi:hypothetical protein GGF50DRAFT_90888 [Schizophyllum commune]
MHDENVFKQPSTIRVIPHVLQHNWPIDPLATATNPTTHGFVKRLGAVCAAATLCPSIGQSCSSFDQTIASLTSILRILQWPNSRVVLDSVVARPRDKKLVHLPTTKQQTRHMILFKIHGFARVLTFFRFTSLASSIYTLMASAILQRRELGVSDPVIGIALETGTSRVHVMFGWFESSGNNCVSVNVAHGSTDTAPSSSLDRDYRAHAIFNLQDSAELTQIGLAIAYLPSHLKLLSGALDGVLAEHVTYPEIQPSCWRLADARRLCNPNEATEGLMKRVEKWRNCVSEAQDASTRDYESDGTAYFLNDTLQARRRAFHRIATSIIPFWHALTQMDLSLSLSAMFAQISSYFRPLDMSHLKYEAFYKRYQEDVDLDRAARQSLGLSVYQDADAPALSAAFLLTFDSVVEQSLSVRNESSIAHVRRAWNAVTQRALHDDRKEHRCHLATLFDRSIALARNGAFDVVASPDISVESLLHQAIFAHDRPDETLTWFKYQTQRQLASNSSRIWDSTEQKERIMALAKERDDPTAAAVGLACVTQKEIILVEQSRIFFRKTNRARQRIDGWRESTSASLASRVVAEPDTAFCDVVSGVTIHRALPDHLRLDKERVAAFNILRDTPTCLSSRITSSIQGFRRTQVSNLRVPDVAQTPLLQLGVPSTSYLKIVRATFDNDLVSSLDEEVDDMDWELAQMVSERILLSSATQNANVDAASGLRQLQLGRLPSTTLLHSAVSAFETAEDNRALDDHLQVITSRTQSQSAHDLMLTVFFVVHRAALTNVLSEDGIKAAHRRLTAGVRHLAALGIYDFPIFCLVTYGHIGILITGWGMKPDPHWKLPWKLTCENGSTCASKIPVMVQIAEENPPIYDLSKPSQALRYALFLLHLRVVHAPRLQRRFEEVRETFAERWRSPESVLELEWTSEQQKSTKIIAEFGKKLQRDMQKAMLLVFGRVVVGWTLRKAVDFALVLESAFTTPGRHPIALHKWYHEAYVKYSPGIYSAFCFVCTEHVVEAENVIDRNMVYLPVICRVRRNRGVAFSKGSYKPVAFRDRCIAISEKPEQINIPATF